MYVGKSSSTSFKIGAPPHVFFLEPGATKNTLSQFTLSSLLIFLDAALTKPPPWESNTLTNSWRIRKRIGKWKWKEWKRHSNHFVVISFVSSGVCLNSPTPHSLKEARRSSADRTTLSTSCCEYFQSTFSSG